MFTPSKCWCWCRCQCQTNVGASESVGVSASDGTSDSASDGTSDSASDGADASCSGGGGACASLGAVVGASGVDGANVCAIAGVGQLRSRNSPCTRSCDSNKNYNLQVRMINEDLQNSNQKSLLKKNGRV
jgi:hypothetical protein